jgi:2-polyprenyl-3-methyl-5-hydroxy-6-metoxy-1,4-benzoquinol methylase
MTSLPPNATSQRSTRPCPVCASTAHDVLYEQRFEEFAAGSLTDAYDVVACRECGMCFASGLPDSDRFAEYYATSSKYDLSAEGALVSPFDVQRYQSEARFIAENCADRNARILDIGTATGELLVALGDFGFTNLHGVDPSPEAARRARDSHGLDVVSGDVAAAIAWGMSFGVVTLVAVLEHLVDPATTLQEIAELLDANGALYLLVPDASSFADHVDAPYQEFSVEHINYFTAASLRNLLASVGLEVVAERTSLIKGEDADGPALEVLCHRRGGPFEVQADLEGVASLRAYVTASATKEAGVLATIASLAERQSPMYVWGTGTNALHLLASSSLGACNIISFLDSNPHYQGRQLAGRWVRDPREIKRVDAPILVASAVSQTAIVAAARELFGPGVPLILMY